MYCCVWCRSPHYTTKIKMEKVRNDINFSHLMLFKVIKNRIANLTTLQNVKHIQFLLIRVQTLPQFADILIL